MGEIVIHSRQIEMLPLASLTEYAANARTHPDSQIDTIVRIIQEHGFTNPLLIDDDDVLIAGHGRAIAAKRLGMVEVPCVRVSGLTPGQIKALRISDNQTGLLSGWSDALLRVELGDLQAAGMDLALTGFADLDLTRLFTEERAVPSDDAPEAPENPVTQIGDLWRLGPHRIMAGSGMNPEHVAKLLDGITPEFANCDPPYGIKAVKGATVGGAKGFGKTGQTREGNGIPFGGFGAGARGRVHGPAKKAIIHPNTYAPIIGDDTTDTAVAAYKVLEALGVPVIVMWGGNYFANALPPSRCWLIWDKENSGTFADAELAWTNQDKVVRLLRHQWNGLMKASERGQRRVHPTQKPVALADWVHQTMAPQARTVLDLFLGSGSVLMAAEGRGITCFGMDLAPAYIDVSVLRWEAHTGLKATFAETGETFEQVKARRAEVV